MSAYNSLREEKGRKRQYDTMELEVNKDVHDEDSKKIYTLNQVAFVIGIVIVLFIIALLLIWFLAPQYRCNNPFYPPLSEGSFPWQKVELPDFAHPVHYSLFIDANQKEFRFQGNVNVTFKTVENTDFVVLNAGNLNVTSLQLLTNGNSVESYIHNVSRQQLYIKFRQRLKKSGNYTIDITFSGNLKQNMEGIYMASYLHVQGIERNLVATHFGNKHAREAFPCFDEPRFKSTFQLSLAHSFDYDPISNTAVKETLPNGKTVTSLFVKTLNISVQSLAFLISDFRPQKRDYEGVSVRIFTPAQFFDEGSFAIQTCIDILKYYGSLKFPISFSKLDISYLPNSGYSGSSALNIIFMKPSDILWNQDGSAEGKEITVSSLAHQIISQYFGNQITMKNWDESWFLEGISTYFEHLAVGQILKEETRNFSADIMRSALRLGNLRHSVPLQVDVRKQSEITNVFDKVSYYKGAALIWMLDAYMGSNNLQNNLLDILEEHRRGSISLSDIWSIMEQPSNISILSHPKVNVSTLMKNWTENRGYPLVTVVRQETYLIISQEPFSLDSDQTEENIIWDIPFTLATDSSPLEYHILRHKSYTMNISKEVEWFKANVNQTGFYRVNYDDPSWKMLSGVLKLSPQTLNQFDRSGLIDDALTLARVGKLDVSEAFDLLDYLKNERDYEPWKTTLGHFHDIGMLMQDHDELLSVQAYFLSVLTSILQTIDWFKEGSLQEIKLRSIVLSAALENENSDVIKQGTYMFDEWMKTGKSISPNLQEVVFWAGIKYGGTEEWDFCWNKYLSTDDPREKMLLLLALGRTRDMWRLKRYLRSSLNGSVVSTEDIPLVIGSVADNPFGILVAWEFIQEYWFRLKEMFDNDSIFLDAILTKTTFYFSTEFKYNQVKSFFEGVKLDTDTVKQCLEAILANIKWRNQIEKKFVDWLKLR